ncbi:glycosyltransferase family 22 protein [Periconia macrospinosa]|uniref:Mannosyltransferase n=1 Tax=Periconia macrospinosa TaxID=97972 RepID=A0A2V1EBA5_9PLEO|nr:glycosyltransferase family 22 protein [Periconia macrospinosa]
MSSSSPASNSQRAICAIFAFRLANALVLRTFFQPDEYFQSLEVATDLAFGPQSNAYITWEWKNHLRSSLHPAIFAAVYEAAAAIAYACGLSLSNRSELLLAAPKVLQALFAALLDWYTWKIAEKAYGRGSRTAYATLLVSMCSPWQWFCSTRTLSNCLETTLTAIGVYHWPWHWPVEVQEIEKGRRKQQGDADAGKESSNMTAAGQGPLDAYQLRLSLLLAAFACVLRPTNGLVWLPLFLATVLRASYEQRYVLVRESFFCGSAVVACSMLSDRLYYKAWTFPPLHFLYFNIVRSLAVFYGTSRLDYYLTEGLPLLLTTALPFALTGLWNSCSGRSSTARRGAAPPSPASRPDGPPAMLPRLACITIVVIVSLSLISHKEVRFLYPVLPFLHVLAAAPLASFFPRHSPTPRKALLAILLAANILIAGYASHVHQRGVIDVVDFLRHRHEARNHFSTISTDTINGPPTHVKIANTTVGFLMPCHSTPWRSHLIHPSINAWALTCEPPIDVPLSERASYLDEADQFYLGLDGRSSAHEGPLAWLDAHMEHVQTIKDSGGRSGSHWARVHPKFHRPNRRPWPQQLVFFEQLRPVLSEYLAGTLYRECWRGFNSHFHDDWRRVGDVVVWCLGES